MVRMSLEHLLDMPQYSLTQAEKDEQLLAEMQRLTAHHLEHCPEYARLSAAFGASPEPARLADVFALPVSLFKTHLLRSVPETEVFKVLTSSGTTGQAVSRIVLDRQTADLQTHALASIMMRLLGPKRLPMIVIDTPNVVKDRKLFSARGAGVLGMANFGRRHFYALDDEMRLDVDGLRSFLERFSGQPILLFGFTFMAWKYFLQQVRGLDLDLSEGTLVHSGGWKKLREEAVSNEEFKRAFRDHTGLRRVHNFYGMVEQVGGVFLEAPDGYLRPPNFGDVIIRHPRTWDVQPDGEPGVVQVLSALPTSYPGHSLLTEDLGVVHGTETDPEGWLGKQVEIIGRVPKAEIRGCSDTHAQESVA
jgi:hypothetical protein